MQERFADPALLRLPDDPGLGSKDAAGERIVGSLLRVRVDVDAGDANGRRAEKAQALCRLLVGNVDEAKFGLDPELAAEPLDERDRGMVVRAPVEEEDLDQRSASVHVPLRSTRRDGWPRLCRRARRISAAAAPMRTS